MSNPQFVLQAKDLNKSYGEGANRLEILKGLDLELMAAERVAIVGRSGSGKSSLLHVLAGLDVVDSGEVHICGEEIAAASANKKAALRGAHLGFVYQNHHLLPEFNALENVTLPMRIAGSQTAMANEQAASLLDAVGLGDRAQHLPSELSGGERQRVAVARALAGNPSVVLADEPTGNLDRENADQVMALIERLSGEMKLACLVVTHDLSMLSSFDRVLNLTDGRLTPFEDHGVSKGV